MAPFKGNCPPKGATYDIILTKTALVIISVWPQATSEKIDNNERQSDHVALSYTLITV